MIVLVRILCKKVKPDVRYTSQSLAERRSSKIVGCEAWAGGSREVNDTQCY